MIDADAPAIAATALGHPLLATGVRVANDVTVGPAGSFLLVTGSNMSGKSTLLWALGTNLVLAGAGGTVCAAAFSAPPVALWTSMRIQDSLAQGVSYYLAELRRLKAIVDAARATDVGGQPRLCYLIDEMLQGTNTAERQIAARRIIAHLVREGDRRGLDPRPQPGRCRAAVRGGPRGPLHRAVHQRRGWADDDLRLSAATGDRDLDQRAEADGADRVDAWAMRSTLALVRLSRIARSIVLPGMPRRAGHGTTYFWDY